MFILPAIIAGFTLFLNKQFYQGLAIVIISPFLTSADQFQAILVVALVWGIVSDLIHGWDRSSS